MKIENRVLLEVTKLDIVNGRFIIPDSVNEIGAFAFAHCTKLESIIIPNSVNEIGYYAFKNCIGLKSITIPNSVTKIGDKAFYNCKKLESITIPDSVTEIGDYIFFYCNNLESINVTKDNKYYSSEYGVLFNKNKTALIQYPKCKKDNKYIIPNSVTLIGDLSFYNCNNLESIIIPNSVTEIGKNAFANCSNLISITIPNSVIKIEHNIFYNCKKLKSITIPDSVTEIEYNVFYNCRSLHSKKGNYKAFKKGLICNNMQYISNEWNTIYGEIKLCIWGLHYVTNLFDIFSYYFGDLEKDIEIWEVEVGDTIVVDDNNSKKATNAIKPIKKLTREEIISILNNR